MKGSSNYQHLVLNQKGFIIQSNDTLFSSKKINQPEGADLIAFSRSILPHIFSELKQQKSVTFSGVDASLTLLPGTYDFIFSRNTNGDDTLIDCWIIERTMYYEDVQQFMQNYCEEELENIAA